MVTEYTMEELVPIVGRLAEKYTAHESSSVTYERAEQLMGAVLYCIREVEKEGAAGKEDRNTSDERTGEEREDKAKETVTREEGADKASGLVRREEQIGMSAKQAYELGLELVKRKTQQALALYDRILPEFDCYGSRCLQDTVIKGMPEFFKWYDCQFAPQNTILTLDYPVLRDLSELTGIDRICAFLDCIRLEQIFLGRFPAGYVREVLTEHNSMYGEMIENICEIVLRTVLEHILVKKPLSELSLGQEDHLRLQAICGQTDREAVKELLQDAVESLAAGYFGEEEALASYLRCAVEDMAVRMRSTVEWCKE